MVTIQYSIHDHIIKIYNFSQNINWILLVQVIISRFRFYHIKQQDKMFQQQIL